MIPAKMTTVASNAASMALHELLHLKLVADAPDGLDHPAHLLACGQLFAQSLDMDVHRSGIAKVIVAPDLLQKLLAGENHARMAGQIVQKLQLLRRHVQLALLLWKYYPCLCLCFGLEQITIIRPRLRINRHFSQILRTEAPIFIFVIP